MTLCLNICPVVFLCNAGFRLSVIVTWFKGSVRNCRLPASNLLLSLRTGSYIFVDASPDACHISEAIFFIK